MKKERRGAEKALKKEILKKVEDLFHGVEKNMSKEALIAYFDAHGGYTPEEDKHLKGKFFDKKNELIFRISEREFDRYVKNKRNKTLIIDEIVSLKELSDEKISEFSGNREKFIQEQLDRILSGNDFSVLSISLFFEQKYEKAFVEGREMKGMQMRELAKQIKADEISA